MSKVLVVYGTKTGCTTGVAERIGQKLAELGAETEVLPAADASDPASYDAFVVGSGVRSGLWHEPVRGWVEDNASTLKPKPVAFYTVGLTILMDPSKADEVRAYTDQLIYETGVQPLDVGLFAGCNDPKRFSLVERSMLKIMGAPEGDFRDWDAIDTWTAQIAEPLGVTR